MRKWIPIAAVLSVLVLVIGAIIALLEGNLFVAGTLLMFTAFAIYIRERYKKYDTSD